MRELCSLCKQQLHSDDLRHEHPETYEPICTECRFVVKSDTRLEI